MLSTKSGFRAVAMVVSFVMLVSACAGANLGLSEPSGPLTPAEQRMRDKAKDFNRTLGEGIAMGAMAGAAAGGGVAVATGKNAWIPVLAGAALGAAMGAVAGSYYAQKKEKYANEEDVLGAMIADAQADNQKTQALIADVQTVAAADKLKMKQIKRDLANKKISQEQAKTELATIDSNRQVVEKLVANLSKRRDEWREAAADARSDANNPKIVQLDREIGKLDKEVALAQRELDALNAHRVMIVG